MRFPFLFSLATLLLLSCSDSKTTKTADKPTDSTSTTAADLPSAATISQLKLQPGLFKQFDSSGMVIIPLMIGNETKRGRNLLSSYSIGGSYQSWNLLFYNTRNGQIRILDETRKMVINSFEYKKEQTTNNGLIFYVITVADFNEDGRLDSEDPDYLFVSNSDGTAFRQLSPNNVDLVQWEQVKGTSLILMTGNRNSNDDKAFNEKDELTVYQIDIAKETNPSVSLPKELEQRLKTTYWKQWADRKEE